MKDLNLYIVSAGAGVCLFGGIGYFIATNDWLVSWFLIVIGLINLIRMIQMMRE